MLLVLFLFCFPSLTFSIANTAARACFCMLELLCPWHTGRASRLDT